LQRHKPPCTDPQTVLHRLGVDARLGRPSQGSTLHVLEGPSLSVVCGPMLARLQSVERAGRCHQRQAHGAAQISFTLQPLDLQMQSQSQIAGVVVSPVSTDS